MTTDKTPRRTVRVPDPLWEAAKTATQDRGENISKVINRALTEYVEGKT